MLSSWIGRARFNPAHFMARGITKTNGFSGVAVNGNIFDLQGARPATIAGAPTAKAYSAIGPTVDYAGGTDESQFTGRSTAVNSNNTFGLIFQLDSLNAGAGVLFAQSFNGGNPLLVTGIAYGASGANLNAIIATSLVSLGSYTFLTGVPYFVATSYSTTNYSTVILRLDTGQLLTFTGTGTFTAPGSADGSYCIGNVTAFGAAEIGGGIAAAMFSPTLHSLQDLLLWAQDPWSFWHEPQKLNLAMLRSKVPSGNTFNDSVTEAANATDADSVVAIFAAAISEAGSATDAETVIATFAAAITETGIAVDSPSATAVFVAADTEAGSATDTSSGAWVTSSAITEAATATDAESTTAVFAVSQTEAGSATDTDVATAAFVASIAEAGSASDGPSATADFVVSDTEAASATDSESTGFNDSVTETATATDTQSATAVFVSDITEAGSAADATTTTAIFVAQASEAGTAADAEDATGIFPVSDTEAASATDTSNGSFPAPSSTDLHSNPFFSPVGPMTSLP